MVEDAVRSATLGTDGEVDTRLHQQILRGTRVWTSDGADLDVGHALKGGCFSGLVCHAWDESHSAGRLLANALKHDTEVVEVDRLLVTGKQPYSLAKFISTSDVFRKKVGDAQVTEGVAFVRNFGGTPALPEPGQALCPRVPPLACHLVCCRSRSRWDGFKAP